MVKKTKTTYYHKKLGPVSKLERRLEKTKAADVLGKFGDHTKDRVKTVATVSTGAAAIGTLGAAAALAAHFAGGPSNAVAPTFHDSYFFHPDPIPLTSEEVDMNTKNKIEELVDLVSVGVAENLLDEVANQVLGDKISDLLYQRRLQIAETLFKDKD